jgi:hypothetical protein
MQVMGHINLFMDENKLKNHSINMMKFSILVKMIKIVEI